MRSINSRKYCSRLYVHWLENFNYAWLLFHNDYLYNNGIRLLKQIIFVSFVSSIEKCSPCSCLAPLLLPAGSREGHLKIEKRNPSRGKISRCRKVSTWSKSREREIRTSNKSSGKSGGCSAFRFKEKLDTPVGLITINYV